MNRDRKFRCDPASWTKGSHSLIEARATPARSSGVRSLTGLLDAFQLGEALRLPFLHAGLFLGELRGGAFGVGLFGECLTLRDSEAAAQLTHETSRGPRGPRSRSNRYREG